MNTLEKLELSAFVLVFVWVFAVMASIPSREVTRENIFKIIAPQAKVIAAFDDKK